MTENEKQKSGILRVFFIEFAVKPSEFDRGFLGRSELILPSKSPLTPSFVADAIAPAANNRYSVPYESSYPSQISALFSVFFAKKCLFLTFFRFPVLLILSDRGANRGVNVGRKGFPYRI